MTSERRLYRESAEQSGLYGLFSAASRAAASSSNLSICSLRFFMDFSIRP